MTVATLLVLFGALLRLLPHAPNFAPVGALALFGGAVLPRPWSFLLPVGVLLLSDALIGFYQFPVMASVYGSFLLSVAIGRLLRRYPGVVNTALGAATGSVLFFLITNFAVWAWGGLYPPTFSGLLLSYAAGVPFFRNTLAGDLFYTGVFFGFFALARFVVRHRAYFRERQLLRHPHI